MGREGVNTLSDEELLRVIKQPEQSEALRVGDMVRIKHGREVRDPDESLDYYSYTIRNAGTTSTVSEITRDGGVRLIDYFEYYRPEWLEKL